ncbi:hypothetical protein ACFVYE_33815 [Streptomyces sp. NPDC058239]
MHLNLASAFGGRQLGTLPFSWIVPLFTIGLTASSSFMLHQRWSPLWLLGPALLASGLTALTFAWRISFGRLQDTRRSATP